MPRTSLTGLALLPLLSFLLVLPAAPARAADVAFSGVLPNGALYRAPVESMRESRYRHLVRQQTDHPVKLIVLFITDGRGVAPEWPVIGIVAKPFRKNFKRFGRPVDGLPPGQQAGGKEIGPVERGIEAGHPQRAGFYLNMDLSASEGFRVGAAHVLKQLNKRKVRGEGARARQNHGHVLESALRQLEGREMGKRIRKTGAESVRGKPNGAGQHQNRPPGPRGRHPQISRLENSAWESTRQMPV